MVNNNSVNVFRKVKKMSVTTTADEHLDRAKEYLEKAPQEIGLVLIDPEMRGANEFPANYIKNCFDRSDDLLRTIDGET